MPVVFTPPEEQPKLQPAVTQEQPQEQQEETPVEAPQIPTVVAANTPNVAFAVPVEGPVVLAPVTRAPPPPPRTKAPAPQQTKAFIPGKGGGGTFPWPTSYPREALEQHLQGTVMIYVVVDPNGTPTQVDIKDSSRHFVLDRFAQQWVKSRWRWLPGETRLYYVPFQFTLQGA